MKNIAVVGMGEMGSIFSQKIKDANVFPYLSKNRSTKTRNRVKFYKIEITSSFSELVNNADIIFSILPCEKALGFAKKLSQEKIKKAKFFVECNPLSTIKIKKLKSYFKSTKFDLIDASIIGPPPFRSSTSLYISGKKAKKIEELNIENVKIKNLGDNFGDASKLKLLFSGINKGLNALIYQIVTTALDLKLDVELMNEINKRIPFLSKRLENQKLKILNNAERYIYEMQEISDQLKTNGFSGNFHKDASATFKYIFQNERKLKN